MTQPAKVELNFIIIVDFDSNLVAPDGRDSSAGFLTSFKQVNRLPDGVQLHL